MVESHPGACLQAQILTQMLLVILPSAKARSNATAEGLSEQQLTIVTISNDLSVSNTTSDVTASPHTEVNGYLSLRDNKILLVTEFKLRLHMNIHLALNQSTNLPSSKQMVT